MKRIWSAVREASGKSPGTISRALTRAATDIWERGNRELLMAIFARTLTKAPTAKALVYTLAEYVKPSLGYRGASSEPRSGAVRAACASGLRARCHEPRRFLQKQCR